MGLVVGPFVGILGVWVGYEGTPVGPDVVGITELGAWDGDCEGSEVRVVVMDAILAGPWKQALLSVMTREEPSVPRIVTASPPVSCTDFTT